MTNTELPTKIIQFGKGNFLRGFSTWMTEVLNKETDFNGGVEIVETFKTKRSKQLIEQDFKYHVIERGIENEIVIDRITRVNAIKGLTNVVTAYDKFLKLALEPELKFIISNTTETGITFKTEDTDIRSPQTFPGRLTALLFYRFQHLSHPEETIFVLPCELIDDNADTLRSCIFNYCELWKLPLEFVAWLNKTIVFCNTLVDRIVSGYPKAPEVFRERLSFRDELMVVCEPYHFWAIEDKAEISSALPIHKTNLNVQFVKDIKPYKKIKVRVLNGAHTAMVALGMLEGIKTVDEFMSNSALRILLDHMLNDDILPTLSQYKSESNDFKNRVFDRFQNPFTKHRLSTIQLNSISKFRTRLLPSLKDYVALKGSLPNHVPEVLAHLLWLYINSVSSSGIELIDEPRVLDIFKMAWSQNDLEKTVVALLQNKELWDEDLVLIEGLKATLMTSLNRLNMAKDPGAFIN
ncbi:tagaturonate reductase [Winogradskyella sp.]|uniref:tagaturonate reductase n=1 Tax=Winogradskyella sp. TaxID=1883156 RepID=UPI003BAC548D